MECIRAFMNNVHSRV